MEMLIHNSRTSFLDTLRLQLTTWRWYMYMTFVVSSALWVKWGWHLVLTLQLKKTKGWISCVFQIMCKIKVRQLDPLSFTSLQPMFYIRQQTINVDIASDVDVDIATVRYISADDHVLPQRLCKSFLDMYNLWLPSNATARCYTSLFVTILENDQSGSSYMKKNCQLLGNRPHIGEVRGCIRSGREEMVSCWICIPHYHSQYT
jgi:hypothetical protein